MGRLSCTSVVTRNVWSDGSHIGTALKMFCCKTEVGLTKCP
jgi:hypothetical protein